MLAALKKNPNRAYQIVIGAQALSPIIKMKHLRFISKHMFKEERPRIISYHLEVLILQSIINCYTILKYGKEHRRRKRVVRICILHPIAARLGKLFPPQGYAPLSQCLQTQVLFYYAPRFRLDEKQVKLQPQRVSPKLYHFPVKSYDLTVTVNTYVNNKYMRMAYCLLAIAREHRIPCSLFL